MRFIILLQYALVLSMEIGIYETSKQKLSIFLIFKLLIAVVGIGLVRFRERYIDYNISLFR